MYLVFGYVYCVVWKLVFDVVVEVWNYVEYLVEWFYFVYCFYLFLYVFEGEVFFYYFFGILVFVFGLGFGYGVFDVFGELF